MPAIEELPLDEAWVGFRPGSRDDAPMLGPSGIERLVIATGHHRNGILLTPITAQSISAYILTGRMPQSIEPFAPDRFLDDRPRAGRQVRPARCHGSAMIRMRVNGVEVDIAATTVAELLVARGVDPAARFLAIAVNGSVVRRAEWPSRELTPGDTVEIVRPLQGG